MNVVPENVYWEQKRAFASIFIFFLSFAAPFFFGWDCSKNKQFTKKKKKRNCFFAVVGRVILYV